jgi:ribosomal-protein-alanine N-acetyltransferase
VAIEFALMQDWHLPSVFELESELFSGEEWSEEQFREELENVPETRVYWVALDDKRVVGYCGILLLNDFADITTIAVVPSHRRKGLGRDMVKMMLKTAKERGASRMLLEVRTTNESAIEFYKKFGFVIIAERPNYYGPGLTAYVMELADIEVAHV